MSVADAANEADADSSNESIATRELSPAQVDALLDDDTRSARSDIEAVWPSSGLNLKAHLSTIELELIRKALEQGGTVAEAARLLQIRRTTLVEKLRKYGLHPSR